MMLCKEAIENPTTCGKTCCCFECEEKDTCKDVCTSVSALESAEGCPDLMAEENQLATFQSKMLTVFQTIANISKQKDELEEQDKQMREQLKDAMEKYGVKSFENELVKVTYVAPTTRISVDSAKLGKLHPEIYAECSKTSNVKSSVKITVK